MGEVFSKYTCKKAKESIEESDTLFI